MSEFENLKLFLKKKKETFNRHLRELKRRDQTNLYKDKDNLLDAAAYLKILAGFIFGILFAKMKTTGFSHVIMGVVILGAVPLFLMQNWLRYPPEKSIEWGGPFSLASDGMGAGLASLILTWSVCHSMWNVWKSDVCLCVCVWRVRREPNESSLTFFLLCEERERASARPHEQKDIKSRGKEKITVNVYDTT